MRGGTVIKMRNGGASSSKSGRKRAWEIKDETSERRRKRSKREAEEERKGKKVRGRKRN